MTLRTLRASSARFVVVLLLFILASAVAFVAPAAAQSREQRQLMADMRMMQEQNQTLQNLLGQIAEAIKAVNARIDEQAGNTGKALADQKLVIDNLTNNVREIREKLDDTNVRLGTLNTEVDALRQGVQQLNARPVFTEPSAVEPGAVPGAGPAPLAPGNVDPGTTTAAPT